MYKKKRTVIEMVFIMILLLAGMFLLQAAVDHFDKKPEKSPALKKCHDKPLSIETLQYQAYFHKANAGIHALEVAKAVQQSKRKRLTAAICMVESGGKKTAYNKKSKATGMYQVCDKIWNRVDTSSALAMTAQHDAIMDELLYESKGNLKKALNIYGGDVSKHKYAEIVLNELKQVP